MIFKELKKAKPGIKTYQPPEDEANAPVIDKVDGGLFNIGMLIAILVLMIASLFNDPLQPVDQAILLDFQGAKENM
jgi:hypothetical protein